jgi:hypothetical protein
VTTAGAVGTYAILSPNNGASGYFVFGSTYAGSGLSPSGFHGYCCSIAASIYSGNSPQSGTWRAMGTTSTSTIQYPITLFVRIA